jgi:hypothetical protein
MADRQAERIAELEQELAIVRRQLEQFQGAQMSAIQERRRAAMQYYREEYQRLHPNYGGPCHTYTEGRLGGAGQDTVE